MKVPVYEIVNSILAICAMLSIIGIMVFASLGGLGSTADIRMETREMVEIYERLGYVVIGTRAIDNNWRNFTIKARLSLNGKEYNCIREYRKGQRFTDKITPIIKER